MNFKKILSSLILIILIIQIATISFAEEIWSVTINKTDEELLEYDKKLYEKDKKEIEKLNKEESSKNIELFVKDIEEEKLENVKNNTEQETKETEEIEETISAPSENTQTEDETENFTWLDGEKFTVKFIAEDSKERIIVSGIPASYENSFYVNIYEENTSEAKAIDNVALLKVKEKEDYIGDLSNKYMSLNKKYYYKIEERQKDSLNKKEISSTFKEIERVIPEIGKRLDLYMYAENKSNAMQKYYYDSSTTTRKMNYKIGKIDNIELLKKFKTDEREAFKELYEYGKKDKGLTSGTHNEIYKEVDFNPASKISVNKDEYYYAYLEMEDEEGKYYPVDDVAIYIGMENNTLIHFAFADMEFNDTKLEDPTTAGVKYPYTGEIAIGTGIIILIGTTYILHRKNKKYQDVK